MKTTKKRTARLLFTLTILLSLLATLGASVERNIVFPSDFDRGVSMRWGMATGASIELNGDRSTLRQDGQSLHARILQSGGVSFEIVETDPPPREYDASNSGTRMLAVSLQTENKLEVVRIVLSDRELSQSVMDQVQKLPRPSIWRLKE